MSSGESHLLLEAERRRFQQEGELLLSIKVSPRSSRTRWIGRMEDGTLKVALAAPPEKGKANEELLEFLAAEFGVARSQVELIAGHASTAKRVRLTKTRR